MSKKTKIGIIICDRYRNCAGGKCFRALKNKEGAFDIYKDDEDIELVGYTSCGGCPGGNIEYAPEEMKDNGADVIHLATGFIVGYPPCPYIKDFENVITEKFGMKVVVGTHPVPEKYNKIHSKLKTWESWDKESHLIPSLSNEKIRLAYD